MLAVPVAEPVETFSITVVPPPAAVVNLTLSSLMFCSGNSAGSLKKASKSVVPLIITPVRPPP